MLLSFVGHGFDGIRTNILLLVIRYLFYCWEILFCHVEVVHRHLIHSYIHYRTVRLLSIKICLPYLSRARTAAANSNYSSAIFFLHFFRRLENWRKQTLILNERAIVIIFTNVTNSSCLTTRHVIFKITVKSLVLAIFNFEVSKVTSAVLSGEWTLFHI